MIFLHKSVFLYRLKITDSPCVYTCGIKVNQTIIVIGNVSKCKHFIVLYVQVVEF